VGLQHRNVEARSSNHADSPSDESSYDDIADVLERYNIERFSLLSEIPGVAGGSPDPNVGWSIWGSLTPTINDYYRIPLYRLFEILSVMMLSYGTGSTSDRGNELWLIDFQYMFPRHLVEKLVKKVRDKNTCKGCLLDLNSKNAEKCLPSEEWENIIDDTIKNYTRTLAHNGDGPHLHIVAGTIAKLLRQKQLSRLIGDLLDGYARGYFRIRLPFHYLYVSKNAPKDASYNDALTVFVTRPIISETDQKSLMNLLEEVDHKYRLVFISTLNPLPLSKLNAGRCSIV